MNWARNLKQINLVSEEIADKIVTLDKKPVTTLDEVEAITNEIKALGLEPNLESIALSVISTMHKASQ